jgi:hypothetical protein
VATFSAQVVDLVGTFSDETALDSFITEGANEVIKESKAVSSLNVPTKSTTCALNVATYLASF